MEKIINFSELDSGFFEGLKKEFGNQKVKISIEPVDKKLNQRQIWDKLEAVRKKYPPFIVSKDINLSELANEVNL
jgi:hypothetical protein